VADPDGPVAIDDPRVLAIPIAECGEELIDARDAGLRVDESRSAIQRISDNPFLVRAGVIARLRTVELQLPSTRRLLIMEGWRPITVQTAIYADAPPHSRRRSRCGPVARRRAR
jgi:D-alanyl-D-alanine dipeptidase